jgi:transglutaminase superfamily protein
LRRGLKATITVRKLGGAVLPTLPNTVAIVASGATLNFDRRSGNIRLLEGEIGDGFSYDLAAAGVPAITELTLSKDAPPKEFERFTEVPSPPSAAKALIDQAPNTSPWERWDWLRNQVLNTITSNGLGQPVAIPPSRVQEILSTTKEASPFELVAIQTLFARWVGIPARIGYGFDGGSRVGDHLEVHPKDGASFPEVYFAKKGWLPVIGVPAKTRVTDISDPKLQQQRPGVLPSEDISVTIFRPVELAAQSRLYQQIRSIALIVLLLLILAGLIYLLLPVLQKARRRSQRRAEAVHLGPRARIIQAYAEWRDLLTDYGYQYHTDTPLMLLRRFPRDEENNQLAWLVTRALWGDMQFAMSEDLAHDAEELSRSLRRRLAEAHQITVRAVAAVSRLSVRSPFVPSLEPHIAHEEEVLRRVA